MKKSEKIREELSTEENDFRALELSTKLIREERSERFEDIWLPRIRAKWEVKSDSLTGRHTFRIPDYGIVDLYPKANKLLIRKNNKWKKPAIQWLVKTFQI